MKEVWNYTTCVSVLSSELGLIKKIAEVQDRIRKTVMNREWADFDGFLAEVNRHGDEFALLEEKRAALFEALRDIYYGKETTEKYFYALVSKLPQEESRELSRLYRELKMEALKIQALNETFIAFVSEAKAMATAYLEAAYPARGGKLYTRKGQKVSQDLRSMVFNNRF